MSILSLESVTYTYRSKYQTLQALKGITCTFEQGRIYAVVGKSGSGKTLGAAPGTYVMQK